MLIVKSLLRNILVIVQAFIYLFRDLHVDVSNTFLRLFDRCIDFIDLLITRLR
jgi:hypothetical protein